LKEIRTLIYREVEFKSQDPSRGLVQLR
jgi:hypothetical protein